MMALNFGSAWVLALLLAIPAIIYFYKIYHDKKKKAAIKFSSLETIKESKKKINLRIHLPFMLVVIAVALIILGLADPRIPLKTAKEGVNVVLVIDDSGSMAATDYKPTRLEAAKKASEILINSLQKKDNIGIVVFESGATTASYLTPFKDKAIQKLRSIEQKQGRTAIGDGLSLAVDMATSIPNKKKVIILLSDGVNNAGVVSPQEAIQFAKVNKINVHAIALGSQNPVVLGYDFFGRPQYAEIDEQALKDIAANTAGNFYRSVDQNTLAQIYSKISKEIQREWEDTGIKDWFFAAALAVLIVNIYIIYGKYRILV